MSDYRFDQARAIDKYRRALTQEGVPADERRRRLYQRFGAAAEETRLDGTKEQEVTDDGKTGADRHERRR